MSVAQADEVIIALPGDKSKISIYDKTPPERGLISTDGFAFCGGGLGISRPSSIRHGRTAYAAYAGLPSSVPMQGLA